MPRLGATWNQFLYPGTADWTALAISANGQHILAAGNNGYLYTSTSNGLSWDVQSTLGARAWSAVASNTSGIRLFAVTNDYPTGGLYLSTDSGSSWTQQVGAANGRRWKAISSSADGMKVVGVSTDGDATFIELSADGGNSWNNPLNTYTAIITRDGTSIINLTSQTFSRSTDWGQTWTSIAMPILWPSSIAGSDDGSILVCTEESGYMYISRNTGGTWTNCPSVGEHRWASCVCSSDGATMAAAATDGTLVVSADSGITWTDIAPDTLTWQKLALSRDASTLYAAAQNSCIYQTIGTPIAVRVWNGTQWA